MIKLSDRKTIYLVGAIIALVFFGCRHWDNFITYFNTYYNMERIRKECESEFDYQTEKLKETPTVLAPEMDIKLPRKRETSLPPFLTEFVINKRQRQPVKSKLDSMVIKGSKILAKHPNSNYIQGSLYLMALSYFYQNLWLNSQIKCGELIDKYPDGELSPDAHLLLAKNLLIQRKFEAGKTVLSRTVDIAWQLGRYDILSEAFRIEAELALFQNDFKEAARPYKQAIIQTDDEEMKAKWQFDLAALFFRMNKFEKAEKLFTKVLQYDPNYMTEFEALLYKASCLARIGRYEDAEKILDELEDDGKYEEWQSHIFAEKMNLYRLKEEFEKYEKAESRADTTFIGSKAIAVVYYERGVEFYKNKEYSDAKIYLGKARNTANPASKKAGKIHDLLQQWSRKRASIMPMIDKIERKRELTDEEKRKLAKDCYEMARVQQSLGNTDSADHYYNLAIEKSIKDEEQTARYYYAYGRFLEDLEPLKSDSLMEIVIDNYALTEYGEDARKRLGYTEAFIIDPVGELYSSGVSLWRNREYDFAIKQFTKLFNYYPDNELAPKSIYTIGWIFEKDLELYKEALEYYKLLIERYPRSEYAADVSRTVAYAEAVESEGEIPDSLKSKRTTLYIPKTDHLLTQPIEVEKPEEGKKKDSKSPGLMDIIKDPGSLFEKAKETVTEESDKFLDEQKEKLKNASDTDSLKKQLTPGININNPFKDLRKDSDEENEKEGEEKEESEDKKEEQSPEAENKKEEKSPKQKKNK